jgi:flagellar hook protein FlgE
MSSAISNALSGLKSNAAAINVVSNNLANLNTSGFKTVEVSFQDLVNQSIAGFSSSTQVSGSTSAKGIQQFNQGTVQTTGNPFDAAIQGSGFFVLKDSSGQSLYTRQGNFLADAQGNLVTQSGQFVQGWNAQAGVLSTAGITGNIVLPTGLAQVPTATTSFSLSVNLNSAAPVGSANAAFSSPMQVIDAQGNSHTLTITYTERAANTWDYAVTIPAADLAPGGTTALANGTLTFDAAGALLSPPAAAGTVPIAITGLANGAADMALTWNLYSAAGAPMIAQNTSVSANISNSQNGLASGQLNSLSIGDNGVIVARFSNGVTENVAQIAVASVTNPSTMGQLDGNSWVPTATTATPVIGVSGTGSRGAITGGALESSTVDIATEFTNLLEFERGYQANSKVITTEDQIVQQTIALIPAA